MPTPKSFDRKLSTDNAGGVGKVRRISFEVEIGGYSGLDLVSWSKDEMSYSAGSSCTVSLPRKQQGQILDLIDVSTQFPFLPLRLRTSIVQNDVLQASNAEDFSGIIDTIDMNMNTGTFDVQAKSFAELFLIPKITEIFSAPAQQAMTTGQAIQSLVNKYGSAANIQAVIDPQYTSGPNSTKIGKIFSQQQVRAITNMSPWDLMEDFARHDNANLCMKGNTLHYQPAPSSQQSSILSSQKYPPSYTFTWGKDILELKATHSPIAAHDITVTVHTWNRNDKKVYTSTKVMSDAKIASMAQMLETNSYLIQEKYQKQLGQSIAYSRKWSSSGQIKWQNIKPSAKQNFVFKISDSTQEDCDRVALKILQDLSQREFIVTLKVLGDPMYHPLQFIKIAGTDTIVDQTYVIKNVHTEFKMPEGSGNGAADGYTTTFTLINHNIGTAGASIG